MQVTELKNEGLDFHIKVVIPSTIINAEVEKELNTLSKKARIDGFRVGKVPASIINKRFNASVKSDVIQHQVSHSIDHIIKDKKLNVVGSPKLEDFKAEEGKDIEFIAKFELMPKVEMPDFKKIFIERPKLEVSDKDIDEQLKALAELSKNYLKESEDKAAKEDQVTINAIGYVDGKTFDGGKLEAYKLVLGSKSFIDTFEDQLIGSKTGEEVIVKVTFPENYQVKDLSGKPAEFQVKVIAIHKPEIPEINNEFAKRFNCETVEKLREQVVKNLEASFSHSIHIIIKMHLFDQLEKLLDFEVPKSLIDAEYQILQEQSKLTEDLEILLKNRSETALEEYYKRLSLRRVRIGLMLADYVQLKNLRIEQDDFKNAVLSQARNFPGQEMAVFEYYQKNKDALEALKGSILEEKAVTHIFENEVNIKEKKYTKKQLEKFLEEENNQDII